MQKLTGRMQYLVPAFVSSFPFILLEPQVVVNIALFFCLQICYIGDSERQHTRTSVSAIWQTACPEEP